MSDNLKPCEICERANCSADLHFPPTLRDQHAMAALTGLLSTASTLVFQDSDGKVIADQRRIREAVALEAYRTADEMLAAREKLTA